MRVILTVFLLLGMGQTAAASASVGQAASDGAKISLPLIIQVVSDGEGLLIGESVAGRPLEVFRFGSGERKKLIVGGIHGGYEWNTIELVRRLIEQVKAHPEMIPADQTLFFLPALNPDGEARSHGIQGRANEHNVDINRNFDYNWKSDWYRVGCWNYLPITAGTRPFSEPEAAAPGYCRSTFRKVQKPRRP